MGAIANIARQRPDYMSRVVQTFEALQGKDIHLIISNRSRCSSLFYHLIKLL